MTDPVKDGAETAEAAATQSSRGASAKIREKGEAARQSVSQAYASARDKASTAYETALDKASSAYGTARDRTADVLDTARVRAAQTRDRATATVEENPLAVLAGGLALGALVAALLPRSRREQDVLGGIGGRINQTGKRVAQAAKDSAREKLDEHGLSADKARDKVGSLLEEAAKAVSSISAAAGDAMQKPR